MGRPAGLLALHRELEAIDSVLDSILAQSPPIAQPSNFRPILLMTDHGDTECRYYDSPGAVAGCVWAPGFAGWHSPADDLYPALSSSLQHSAIASVQVRYRDPTLLTDCIQDVSDAIRFLEAEGIQRIALIGHSFGGAVVINAAARSPAVKAVVTLATQCSETEIVSKLGPDVGLMVIHGRRDHILPVRCSEAVYTRAAEPKRLILLDEADHNLDESADELREILTAWLLAGLAPPEPAPSG